MRAVLKVLHVEDSTDDEALVVRALRSGSYDISYLRVETREELKAALKHDVWDLVISDYSLPQYDGLTALADVRETGLDLPFILVSGTIGEARAVEAIRAGAHDYVLKDRLARLAFAAEREVREARRRAEQRKTEERLVISERMASAGTLAAGVAHEINNPLAVVMANLDFIACTLERLTVEAEALLPSQGESKVGPRLTDQWLRDRLHGVDEPLQDAQEAVGRIRNIVRDVKLFSRPDEEKRTAVDIHRVIDSSLRMAWNEIRHRARLVKDYGKVAMIDANEARVGQIILNLVVNAAQAMQEGDATHNEIRITTLSAKDGRVLVRVSDTGPGIPAENLERIFDPFFTTKPIGVGTGLGLAICRRIVQDMEGEISVESEVGRGTTMQVSLPAATTAPARSPSKAPPALNPARRRVLVIDDEAAIGCVLSRGLGRVHDVTSLTSGKEALRRIAAGQRFDAIITDLMMPDVTGMAIHEELLRLDPGQASRMIFLSGGAFTAKASEFLDRVPNPRVEKPFEVSNLLGIIAEIS